jgi:hypothetical protein
MWKGDLGERAGLVWIGGKEKSDKQQGKVREADMPRGPRLDAPWDITPRNNPGD